ncbi:CBS domain-containing protein, partial [Rhodoferax sp.]|uniref:CBS domain-containing protein n=1 Tax=Rhodoferax sp. TaxID=50421 RepID=UPI0019EDDFEF
MPTTPKPSPLLTSQLSRQRAFVQLSAKSRDALASQFTLVSVAAGTTLMTQGQLPSRLVLILSGAVRLSDPDLNLSVQLEAGDLFGFGATPAPQLATWQAVAAADCELAWLSAQDLAQLCAKHTQLAYFFPSCQPAAQPQAGQTSQVSESGSALNLLGTPIRTLIKREPITLPPDSSIQDTAVLMRDRRVSSVLLVEQGLLFGLVTDRDMRNRVVALNLDISRPVADIATLAPMTVSANSPAFEALLLMARHNIHHMPVMDGSNILGMITATDLTEQHST